MADFIPAPTIGEILQKEFLEPMNLSAYKLAQEIHVPVSRIQDIFATLSSDEFKILIHHCFFRFFV